MARRPFYAYCFWSLVVNLLIVFRETGFALDCPSPPQQVSKDWQTEVDAAVAKIGPVRGADLKTQTKNVTQDLLAKLPDAGKIYLEQMMFAAYCSALRDDKTTTDARKAQLLREYSLEVRGVVAQHERARGTTTAPQPRAPSTTIEPKVARFGVTLGWQLARYEFAKDSPFPEVAAAARPMEEQIRTLLQSDGCPIAVGEATAVQAIGNILTYYATTNLDKHAAILIGIAALRVSLVGASSNPAQNDEMKNIAFSAIRDIDDSVVTKKQELFQDLLKKRPRNVNDTLSVLAASKLR